VRSHQSNISFASLHIDLPLTLIRCPGCNWLVSSVHSCSDSGSLAHPVHLLVPLSWEASRNKAPPPCGNPRRLGQEASEQGLSTQGGS